MKRGSSGLVDYSSSEPEEEELPQPNKKRKLPLLPASLTPSAPIDDPSLHQGRIRSAPHVEGHFAAHAYVALILEPWTPLHGLIEDILLFAKESAPSLQELGRISVPHPVDERLVDVSASKQLRSKSEPRELHISLSHPIYLRAHQRETFKRSVKYVAEAHYPFTASFSAFSELTNDERTRTFLTLEIGAGHSQLQAMVAALTPALRAIRQKEYYSEPKFHASIAWALLDRPQNEVHSKPISPEIAMTTQGSAHINNNEKGPGNVLEFSTIPYLPVDLIPSLSARFASQLASPKVGSFTIDALCVKIGKDTAKWYLGRN